MVDKRKPVPIIDLTDEVNANWRDILRENPEDARFQAQEGQPREIHLGPGVPNQGPEELEPGDFDISKR